MKKSEKENLLTTQQVAKRLRKPYPTVALWARQGRFPNAVQEETPRGKIWWIPESDLLKFVQPKPGRPSTKADSTKNRTKKRPAKKLTKAEADDVFDLAGQASLKLLGAEQTTWLDRLDFELDNLRGALDYYRKKSSSRELELAVLLSRYWHIRGHWTEGRETLQRGLRRQQTASLRAQGLAWLGLFAYRQDDYEYARQVLSESVTTSRALDDKECLAFALLQLGSVAAAQSHYQEAKLLLRESLQAGEEAEIDWLIGEVFNVLGTVAELEGDHAAAREFYLQDLSRSEKIQDLRGIASALNCLGSIAREQGNYDQARRYHERSLALRQGMGNRNGVAYCYFRIGLVEEAAGEHKTACRYFQKSLAEYHELGNKLPTAKAMEAIGRVVETMGDGENAARMLGAAKSLRTEIAAPLSPTEQKNYGQIMTSLKERFPLEWYEGSQWQLDEAIAYAASSLRTEEKGIDA